MYVTFALQLKSIVKDSRSKYYETKIETTSFFEFVSSEANSKKKDGDEKSNMSNISTEVLSQFLPDLAKILKTECIF